MQALLQDLKFAARTLSKNLGFTAVAVLTLALGIGATSAIFSVVNAVILHPLPYRDPSQLLFLSGVVLQTKTSGLGVSFTKYSQIREQSSALEGITAYYGATLSLVTHREPEAINGARATRDLFPVLGVTLARGRGFLPEEEAVGAADVAIISASFWHSHFAADENILGRSLTLDGRPAT